MSSSESETFPTPTLAPTTDDPLTAQEAFDRLQTDLSDFPSAVDLVVAADEPTPIGRSWAFDWTQHRFVKFPGALGPKQTYGEETLGEWVEKVLHTARGAHPVHPPGYGFDAPQGLVYGGTVGQIPPDFEDRVRDALTFHPNISDVEEFTYDYDRDDEFVHFSARIILDNDTALELQDVRLTQTL